ncbi:thioesterase domain-containing protein [Pseudorhodoplanes sp.]|uniref:thioesterase domain-containing protein n=1 Tax=Pseudorhodoplanes sp. TaxID=1934341 RepID=UPI002C2A116D|nr:thioesterase domain-containing protein [Pseudorhodoplanes sp.]HWV42802.1 thioesterase domain-containing protein [Pseudorhodoplanes sp.]
MCRRPVVIASICRAIFGLVLIALAACSSAVVDSVTQPVPRASAGSVPGHVYLLRGLVGEVFSLGFYDLAERIRERGVYASVHSMYAPGNLAGEIIAKHRQAPAPIVLIGHSSGADVAIAIAERLRAANIPVAIMFGFDPTPIAGRIPDNVELFINLYQKTNLIGGGEARAASGFRGRIVNVDLRERREIIHITLDKSPVIHVLVADKIGAILRARVQASPVRSRREAPVAYVTPLTMRYVVPPNVPIVLWDSAMRGTLGADETLEAFASRMDATAWAIASVNNVRLEDPPPPGTSLLVPRSIYATAR